jgi:hypothetical protein
MVYIINSRNFGWQLQCALIEANSMVKVIIKNHKIDLWTEIRGGAKLAAPTVGKQRRREAASPTVRWGPHRTQSSALGPAHLLIMDSMTWLIE